MGRTISGTGTLGIRLALATDDPLLVRANGTIDTAGAYAVYGAATTPWTVFNMGLLAGATVGVTLVDGGTVTNGSAAVTDATIRGGRYGIAVTGTLGHVTNRGSVVASAGGAGIVLAAGGSVVNGGLVGSGALIDGGAGVGIVLGRAGRVINGSSEDGSARIVGAQDGVVITTPTTLKGRSGTVQNSGTILATNSDGDGIVMHGNGVVSNSGGAGAPAPTIAGGRNGILVTGGGGVVGNLGTVSGGGFAGIWLDQGGFVANGPLGTITGAAYGIRLDASVYASKVDNLGLIRGAVGIALPAAGGLVTNAGTIVGDGGIAVQGGSGDDTVGVTPDGRFDGLVVGGAGNNTLALLEGVGPGTLTGLGTAFLDIDTVSFASNAVWTLAAAPAALAGVQAISGFAGADAIELADVTETFQSYAGGQLTLSGDVALTLSLPGLAAADFVVTPIAGGTRITLDRAEHIFGQAFPADEFLAGGGGNDTVDGLFGADTLAGGPGDDTLVVHSAADLVVEAPGEGTDTVHAFSDYVLPDTVENLVLEGTARAFGWGNSGANLLTGNAGPNQLRGGAGDDTLAGGDGRDALVGGTGQDSLDGGRGNDTLDGGPGADTLAGGLGNDTYLVDNSGDTIFELAGTDTVVSALPFFVLPDAIENLTLAGTATTGWGNSAANLLAGNATANQLRAGQGDDTLDGGAGADTLTGGTGADVFTFHAGQAEGDVVTDFTAAGHDLLRFTGYGSAADGATFSELTATDWRITAAGGVLSETIHFANAAAIAPADYQFA